MQGCHGGAAGEPSPGPIPAAAFLLSADVLLLPHLRSGHGTRAGCVSERCKEFTGGKKSLPATLSYLQAVPRSFRQLVGKLWQSPASFV